MSELDASVLQAITDSSYQLAKEAQLHFENWKAGNFYIPKPALRAMARRYLYLRDRENLTLLEVYEFGRMYAFFCLVYPPDGEPPHPAQIAIDYCNLLAYGLPLSANIRGGGGGD